jgi:putative transposase
VGGMARKPRIEYEGAFYHVIIRGNQRQKIFRDNQDYRKYLDIVSGYKKQYHYRLFAYVLMGNHVHLLVETQEVPLSKIQQGINQRYTMYFNRRYKTVGHLFQGRYKAILCDRDIYLLSLIKYIHLNPVRVKIVKMPEDYRWSSHRNYSERFNDNAVDTEQVLRMFSEEKSQARRLYKDFMRDGININKEDIYRTVDQRILGDESFVEKISDKTEERIKEKRKKHEHSLEEIAKAIEAVLGITIKQMREKGKDREISLGRKLMGLAAHEYGYKGRDVAKYLRKDPAIITRYLKERNNLTKETGQIFRLLNGNTNVNRQV